MNQSIFNPQITYCPGSKYPGNCLPVAWVEVVERLRGGRWKECADACAAMPKEARAEWKRENAPLLVIGASLRYRNADPGNLIAHSGLLCQDLDGVEDIDGLRRAIAVLPFVALVCKSISGTGLFCVVRIPPCNADTHKRYYSALQDHFAEQFNTATTMDAAPKSIASARYVSYDPDLYSNSAPAVFDQLPAASARIRPQPSQEYIALNEAPAKRKVWRLASDAISRGLDITSDYGNEVSGYNDWLCIAGTLAGLFGETARDLYHRLSCLSPNYSDRKTDHKFTEALKKGFAPRIGAFINICKKYGLETSNQDGEHDQPLLRRRAPVRTVQASPVKPVTGVVVFDVKPIQWGEMKPAAARRPDPVRPAAPFVVASPPIHHHSIESVPEDLAAFRREDWSAEITALEFFWSTRQIPAGPIRLNDETTIVNPGALVSGHLAVIRANNGLPTFRPYLNRLNQLKQIIVQ